MIIIDNLSRINLLITKPLVKFGFSFYYYQKSIKRNIKKTRIYPIDYKQGKKGYLNYAKFINYGEYKVLRSISSQFFSKEITKNLSYKFLGVTNLREKLIHSFESSFALQYRDLGNIYCYSKLNCKKKEKIFIIHTNIINYLCRLNYLNFDKLVFHIYLPFDDIFKILNNLFMVLFKLCNKLLKKIYLRKKIDKKEEKTDNKIDKKTAIIFHGSLSYGKLFLKNHYFSKNKKSKLYPSKLMLFVINQQNKGIEKYKNNHLIPLKKKIKLKHIYSTIILFLISLTKIKNLKELIGLLYSCIIYQKFLAYKNIFKNTKIKNVIYDYDLLFPKSFSMALESQGINTIGIQERPSMSFGFALGVIAEKYLFAGDIYHQFGKNNGSHFFKESFNFGMWRLSLFKDPNLLPLSKISFINNKNKKINNNKKIITFLGYYFDKEDNLPGFNSLATDEFLNYIKKTAQQFSDFKILLRMKFLKESDKKMIMEKFAEIDNFFLCDDYYQYSVSYRICKDSTLIISVLTSLGDECIAFGKKVIYLNNFYPVSNLCKEVLPKDFHFAIVKDEKQLLKLASFCIDNNKSISEKYLRLKKKISGNFNFSKKDIFSEKLESFLI